MSERFALDWLKLRESADLAARNATLTRRFAAALSGTQPLRLLDLAAGSGANTRALLPRLPGDQQWRLIDRDRDLLAAQSEEFTRWARRQGYPITAGGGRARIDTGAARWQIEAMPLDLGANMATLEELEFDAMTASSFFDLVSRPWLERFVAMLAKRPVPFLAVLHVDGRREWLPAIEDDALIAQAFAEHQQSNKDFGPALGTAAPAALETLLRDAGFDFERAASDWRLTPRDEQLLAAMIADEAAAARESAPESRERIDAWESRRGALLRERSLSLTIGHCDLLALPA